MANLVAFFVFLGTALLITSFTSEVVTFLKRPAIFLPAKLRISQDICCVQRMNIKCGLTIFGQCVE